MFDRIVFGTSGARDALMDSLGSRGREALARPERSALIPALPAKCDCPDAHRERTVLFLGALSSRKGFDLVASAWPTVRKLMPDARLTIVGQGPQKNIAHMLADGDVGVTYLGPQSRAAIHKILRSHMLVVLPSQPANRWREQVGLPIVEALSHGCRIVTTAETGLTDWLRANGAAVLETNASVEEIARSIYEQLEAADSVLAYDLPAVDGRISADRWLLR
ncbi:glycosyltransferase [Microbacterium lacus]|uniref:glycosyltransferase n=1 Tax=Microbacterium lacus TaxID=415217 RepID=UPI0012FD8E04|nr:glycosyltransferase [Microbacterium lacus]